MAALHPIVFAVASQCFADIDEAAYAELTSKEAWAEFLAEAELALADAPGRDEALSALADPPSFDEHRGFCRSHFTGGLPQSALPVESLYRESAGNAACYGGDSASYMRALIESMGLDLPQGYAAWPDHLALELDMLSLLAQSGRDGDALAFLAQRFDWLSAYRDRLMALDDSRARFYVALVDAVMQCARRAA